MKLNLVRIAIVTGACFGGAAATASLATACGSGDNSASAVEAGGPSDSTTDVSSDAPALDTAAPDAGVGSDASDAGNAADTGNSSDSNDFTDIGNAMIDVP